MLGFLGGALPEARAAEVDDHVESCDSCRRLLRLVAASGEVPTGDLASDPTLAGMPPLATPSDTLAKGAKLGRYVVVDVLGKGGMGVVYAAFDPELDRKVAVKLLHPALAGEAGAQRLIREGRAIAKLAHPNVVGVYDVGTHDGAVFVAMELVDGSALDQWIAKGPHPWREVVDKFVQAGQGLIAAHEAGMVHRDFKPANVLLGKDGRIRVTDFGLARFGRSEPHRASAPVLAEGSQDDGLTRTGAIVGTPAYMAPEQFAAETVDETTDQFSFGVALYEALYGERPFAGATFAELAFNVSEGNTKPPPQKSPVPARVRAIAMRALRPARTDRYAKLADMLDELRATTKSARKRWIAAGAAGLVLAGGTIAIASQLGGGGATCSGGEAKVAEVWNASEQAEIAKAFAATNKPYAARAWEAASGEIEAYTRAWADKRRDACEATAREEQATDAMELRMACLDRRLVELRDKLAIFKSADETIVERAPKLAGELHPLADCDDLAALRDPVAVPPQVAIRAEVEALRRKAEHAQTLTDAGKTKEAAPEIAAVVERANALGFKPLIAEALMTRARIETDLGESKAAEATYRDALVAALAGNQQRVAVNASIGLMEIAGIDDTRYEEALRAGAQAEAIVMRIDPGGPLESDLHYYRGTVLMYKGDYEPARAEIEKAVALREKNFGKEHQLTAAALSSLSLVERNAGHADRAYELDKRSIAMIEKLSGPLHPDLSKLYGNMANTLEVLGKIEAARDASKHSLEIAESALGPEHVDTGTSLYSLARLEKMLYHTDEASALLARARKIFELDREQNAYLLARTIGTEMGIAFDRGDYAKAEALNAEAWAIEDKILPPVHPQRARALYVTGVLKKTMGKVAEGREMLERALAMRIELTGEEHPDVVETLGELAKLEADAKNAAKARAYATRAVAIGKKLGEDTPDYGTQLEILGGIEYDAGDYAASRDHYLAALAIEETAWGKDAPNIGTALLGLADAYAKTNDAAKARPLYERCIAVLAKEPAESELGKSRARAKRALASLAKR